MYKAKQTYYSLMIRNNAGNPKLLFRTIDKLLQRNSERLYPSSSDDSNLANSFADFFASKIERIQQELLVNKIANGNALPVINTTCLSTFNAFESLSDDDVLKLICGSAMKSCPLDPLPASIMKKCYHTLLPVFTRIINLSLDTGSMPERLKIAMLSPLLKKINADHELFSNFRPVSNLKFVSKLIEKAVFTQLNRYLIDKELHETLQSAYKACHSTETALLLIHNDILQSLDNGQCAILILLDLSAAFDTVNHNILLSRLHRRFGIGETALEWFYSYLNNRSQFVDINGSYSTKRDLKIGVPQGSVLGPLLYLMFTSPLAEVIKEHKLRYHLYADDTQLYLTFKPIDAKSSIECVEKCVGDICRWMNRNELKLNQGKTEILIMHSKFRPRPPLNCFQIGSEAVLSSSSATSLGVVFDDHMSFEEHIKQVCRSSFFHLRNLSRIRSYLSKESAEVVIHAFITSRLDYCNSLLFGLPNYLLKKLQHIHNSAARIVTRTGRYEHITPILIQLHWLPVQYRITFKILLLVYKALNGLSPVYLTNLLSYRTSTRSLRSISNEQLLVPRSHTKTYGDRSFSIFAPRLWNNIPLDIRKSSCVDYFKKDLKTYLFSIFISKESVFYNF